MYRYLKLRCLCTKGESLKKCLRCLWSVDHQRRSFEVSKTSYQVFKVALYMYRVKIAKEEVKLQSLYQVFEVALSMYRKWITKEVVDGVLISPVLRAVCCKDQLRSCNIEKTDFPKLCQNKGLGELVLKI